MAAEQETLNLEELNMLGLSSLWTDGVMNMHNIGVVMLKITIKKKFLPISCSCLASSLPISVLPSWQWQKCFSIVSQCLYEHLIPQRKLSTSTLQITCCAYNDRSFGKKSKEISPQLLTSMWQKFTLAGWFGKISPCGRSGGQDQRGMMEVERNQRSPLFLVLWSGATSLRNSVPWDEIWTKKLTNLTAVMTASVLPMPSWIPIKFTSRKGLEINCGSRTFSKWQIIKPNRNYCKH